MEAPIPIPIPSAWWQKWVEEALTTLDSLRVLQSLRPICLQRGVDDDDAFEAFEVFDVMQQWDRSSVQVQIHETTFRKWMHDTPSSGKLSFCTNFFCCMFLHVQL